MSITARGGYQIIDLKNTPITVGAQDPVIINGVFEQARNIGKNAIICNLALIINGDTFFIPPIAAPGCDYVMDENGNVVTLTFTIFAGSGSSIKYDLGIIMGDQVVAAVSHE